MFLLPRLLAAAVVVIAGAVDAQPQPLASRTDAAGLYSLRASLGVRARDWPAKTDPCAAWTGVECRAGRVVSVTVAGLRPRRRAAARATTPLDGLRRLTALERFNASGFPVRGEIPAAWLPPPLAVLDLTSAGVTGTLLPASGLGASASGSSLITTLLLAGNHLTGPVPASLLLSVKGIRFLDLSRNNFTGDLPILTVTTTATTTTAGAALFNISGNSLYGVAGDALRVLRSRFQVVDVSSNYLAGTWNGSSSSDNGAAVVVATMNCFSGGVPGQRSRAECEEFYRNQGVRLLVDDDAPAPAPSPSPPSPQPPLLPEKEKKKQKISKTALIAVLVAAGSLMILFLVALLTFCLIGKRSSWRGRGVEPNEEGGAHSGRRRRDSSSVNPVASSSPSAMSPIRANNDAAGRPKSTSSSISAGEFTFEQLVHATGDFNDDNNLLKHGHSGDIYHGILENGSHVIVKNKVGAKCANKHASELDFYKRYTHERIVPLLGHFTRGDDDEFLAYKYMPKGDLTHALHKKPVEDEGGLASLDWITRLKIATGMAEAMCFLHHECNPPLVHRDIQASSVLLDDKFEVRLGSMSEICAQQSGGSQNVLSRILRSSKSLEKHTSGPPATCSYDVHCFGKVLLELVTGNLSISAPAAAAASESDQWLTNTLDRISAGDKAAIGDIVDPLLLAEDDHLEEAWAVAVIARTCLRSKPSRRPSARHVLRALENPLRVVRDSASASRRQHQGSRSSSSSRSSWQSAFQQLGNNNGRADAASGRAMDRRHSATSRSFGSGGGGASSFSYRRTAPEIVPEPPAELEDDDDDVVV